MSITTLLEEVKQDATSNRDSGDKFEQLVVSYLKNDAYYQNEFTGVYLWMDWSGRNNQPDTGIDIVAENFITGDVWAIQCKFYDANYTLQKSDIDSFFTASGKKPFTHRMIVSTTDKWSKHAEEALSKQHIPVTRIGTRDLDESTIDWGQYSFRRPGEVNVKPKKQLRPHQKTALDKVIAGFAINKRGMLIMACGTGKTFTSLKIAEQLGSNYGYILFLVPSISLLSQTLREWTAEATIPIHSIAVCSDKKVGKKSDSSSEDIAIHDLPYPATTDVQKLASQIKSFQGRNHLTVIFSTYQSIEVVAEAQKHGLPEFELIICDEAHRTTGVTLEGEDESHFVKVHNQDFIKAKKRLYMTATPRLYNDGTKSEAKEGKAELCSMDDERYYGHEFHRLGFSEAVSKGLLTDYKVMVLAVDEKYVSKTFQAQIADENNEINLDDAVKITGCWNGLSKRLVDADNIDPRPMRRAVAFNRTIKDSQRITQLFSDIIDRYLTLNPTEENLLTCQVEHVDGSFNALRRNEKLDWLKADTNPQENICRILSNARCLSEGVDVPDLDAVIFLTPRNSVIDVVQSVGRVMRKAEGKQYGYIILPIGIPADMTPEEALKDNQKYKVVWQVLQALRAHDDRFNATINQIELNKKRPNQINIIGVGEGSTEEGTETIVKQTTLNFPHLEEWRDAIYGKIVVKCGDRRYWENWAKDVAKIAQRHTTRIKALLEDPHPQYRSTFNQFLQGLQTIINPSIDEDEAIDMLSQHLITKPVFDALFEGYEFTNSNPVSKTMQKILDLLEGENLQQENSELEGFYESVRNRAKGVDNAKGKQKIILELYDKFFQTAFPKVAKRLGIVYTPVEVVDFIIKSVNEALKTEFNVTLSDPGVDILEPFTGTGTFITRLLQSGLIKPEDLYYKYHNEIHANEILLLAYYIAAINIEETYHELTGGNYQTFPGIVLTDTFQMTEGQGTLEEIIFPETNQRIINQNKKPIHVIIGNPPYSAGQTSENDGNKNLKYPQLDQSIRETYAEYSSSTNKNSLYDSYIRGIRWASNRIKTQGIVCYVTNGSFIDSNSADGIRKSFADEFTSIYCFNLRGNTRLSGENARMEGGQIFGSGSRATIAITLLIKNPAKAGKCEIHYSDIGDYLSREEKLQTMTELGSFQGIQAGRKEGIKLNLITPNSSHDWINQRDPSYEKFISLGDKKDKTSKVFFDVYSGGVKTNRDNWVYNFSRDILVNNMTRMIDFYNYQVEEYQELCNNNPKDQKLEVEKFIDNDPKKISWSDTLKTTLGKFINHCLQPDSIVRGMYRPYCKQWVFFDRRFNERVYQMPKIFPNMEVKNLAISVTGMGATKDFSALIVDTLPDLEIISKSQCFPLYSYAPPQPPLVSGESGSSSQPSLFNTVTPDSESDEGGRRDNITDEILREFRTTYEETITKEDIFYYIYGLLHSAEYKRRFESDLKKMLPRIPYAEDFWAFSKAGRELAEWHLNYETIEPYPLTQHCDQLAVDPKSLYRVSKMTFGKKNKAIDKTTIIYNSHITLTGIPLETYEYIVNGKPALEWIMERYQVTTDKDSLIRNDPNDWSEDPQYILNLVKRIVRVSIETVKIVEGLPALNER